MHKLIKAYGLAELFISAFFLGGLIYFNYLFFKGVYAGGVITEKISFTIVFINIIGMVIVFLPLLEQKAKRLNESVIKEFLALPDAEAKFTFLTISDFLGNQALSSASKVITL